MVVVREEMTCPRSPTEQLDRNGERCHRRDQEYQCTLEIGETQRAKAARRGDGAEVREYSVEEEHHDGEAASHLRVVFRDGMMGSSMCLPRTLLGVSICSIQDVFDAAKPVLLPSAGASHFTPRRGYVSFQAYRGYLDSIRLEELPAIDLRNLIDVTFTDY